MLTEHLTGTPDQVRKIRQIIAGALGEAHPCVDDAVLLASEIATNAVRHSDSARLGGEIALTVEHADIWTRVTVRDDGSMTVPCLCPVRPTATHGRGMKLLDALAVRWVSSTRRAAPKSGSRSPDDGEPMR